MTNPQCMTRRMNLRIPVRLPVIVQSPPRADNNCQHTVTRDMSFGGAFVEQRGAPLHKGGIVRLALEGACGDPLFIDALVLRSDELGAGLMFSHYEHAVFDSLAALLEPDFERYLWGGNSAAWQDRTSLTG